MGAETTWKVRVGKVVEDIVEVSAVTRSEAMLKAKVLDEVVLVYAAWPEGESGV